MKILLLLIALLIQVNSTYSQNIKKPKLVLQITVDQLRATCPTNT